MTIFLIGNSTCSRYRPSVDSLLKNSKVKKARRKRIRMLNLLQSKESLLNRYSAASSPENAPPNDCACQNADCDCYPSRPNSAMDRQLDREPDVDWHI